MASRIGFNPQDKFMVSLNLDELIVTTTSGNVFGAAVLSSVLQPLFQFTGAPHQLVSTHKTDLWSPWEIHL